jgi:ABC-type nitrate/sulfonate/bicarbonate transport system substrate-binding protein
MRWVSVPRLLRAPWVPWVVVLASAAVLTCAPASVPSGPGGDGPLATEVTRAPAEASRVLPAREPRHITVASPSNAIGQVGFYIAVQEGFAAEEGLDAEIVRISGTASAQTMVAKQVDFGMSAGALLTAYMRGAPARNVFVQIAKPLYYLFSQPDGTRPADIEGKSVGVVAIGDSTHLAAKAALRAYGVDPEGITYVPNLGGSQAVAALESKAVAASSVSAPFDIVAERAGFARLAFMGDYLDYLSSGLATHEDTIRDEPALVLAAVRAELKGHRFMQQNRAATIQHMARFQEISLEDAERSYDLNSRFLTRDGTSEPAVLEGILRDQERELREQGIEPRATTVDEAFRLEFAHQANEQLDREGWQPRP